MSFVLIKKPSAVLPMVMSLVAIALVVGHTAIYGSAHEADEGTPAHLFQLLMAAQAPVVAIFAARWLPEKPVQALGVLMAQASLGLTAFGLAYWLT